MSLVPVACHSCGAPLEVPDEARFITCRHCGVQLEFKHNESAAWTEQIEAIDERTQELQEQVARLEYQNALEAIDRDWDRERNSLLIRHKDGRTTEPSTGGAIASMVIAGGMGIFVMIKIHPGFGLLFLVVGIMGSVFNMSKASRFQAAQRRHRNRKSNLRLDDFRQGGSSSRLPPGSSLPPGFDPGPGSTNFRSWGEDS